MTEDDRLAADVLGALGVTVSSAAWDDPAVAWWQFDAVVLRSTWNYHHTPTEYARWLLRLSAMQTVLWNPATVVLANMHKRYLVDWAQRGVLVVPAHYVPISSNVLLRELLDARGWHDAVIKPAVSASAHGTWRTSRATADADASRFAEQSRSNDLLIQPYLPEIVAQGEWSMVFFGDAFSHAVLKRPALGDFRVQEHLGGHSVPVMPPPHLVAQARAVLSMIEAPLLFARVDGLEVDGRFLLMELEINEPCLFLGCSPDAPARFAAAIIATL
jgi:hypothetical protein